METKTISFNENYSKSLKEKVQMVSPSKLRGEVSIYQKKNGILTPHEHKSNMIVYGGREWLLRKAFGSGITGADSTEYNAKNINWFAVGCGGGEPGNPLQAGSTYGFDSALYQPVRLRDDLTVNDATYTNYGSNYNNEHGYYKKFSSITIKEDHGNPYTDNLNNTIYPALIAEIRIELSSDDANGGAYADLNEAALFAADSNSVDPGKDSYTPPVIADLNIKQVKKDGNYAIYYLDSQDIDTNLVTGDYLYTTNTNEDFKINEDEKSLIVDVYHGTNGLNNGYVVVEKIISGDSAIYTNDYPVAHFTKPPIVPYLMFSRVTFSTLRKTIDREVVILWRIYF